jgi:hypothetical protein
MRSCSYASPPHSKKQSHNIKPSFLECASPQPTLPNLSRVPRPPSVHCEMERRRSLDNGPIGRLLRRRSPNDHCNVPGIGVRGSVVNYLSNPRFRSRCAHGLTTTSVEMDHWHQLLSDHAVMISDDGPMKTVSREEVKEIIFQHFGIHKGDFYVTRTSPKPYLAYFYETESSYLTMLSSVLKVFLPMLGSNKSLT